MSLKVGIVGLPNVGKSTLFNALLKKRVALSANYPFATVEPNVGVVAVPDARLGKLADLVKDEEKMESLPPLVPAVVEFVDIAGLVKGASMGEGLGNQFLATIREVDAVCHVLRDFSDENVIRAGAENPDSDRLTVETELSLSDLTVVEKLVDAAEKTTKSAHDPIEFKKLEILRKIKENLEQGKIIGEFEIGDERVDKWFKTLPLLTTKPTIFVYNVSEEDYSERIKTSLRGTESDEAIQKHGSPRSARDDEHEVLSGNSLVISAKLEEDLADLSDQEKMEYLGEMGIEETGLERLIKKAYYLLGLISYLTAGKKEVRAWTVKKGSKAPVAAGVIHTDFEKGFIRASVIEYQKLIEAGSYQRAKQLGQVRTEGKEYEVKDGDVVEFLISS